MEIRTTYVCDGAIYCGFKPKGVKVKEERQVLYPVKGYKLKKDDKFYSSVWLKDGDVKENYTEVKAPKKEEKKNNKQLHIPFQNYTKKHHLPKMIKFGTKLLRF